MFDLAVLTGMNNSAFTGLKALLELSQSAKCISFDFFDTLFTRPIEDPEDVFDLLERELSYPQFKRKRQNAQLKAFQIMAERGDREITLAGIYDAFDEPDVAQRHRLMQAEYDLELQLLEPIHAVLEILQKLLEQGKQVVVTSDMYLPRAFFVAALQAHGLGELPLFISADRNATKRDRGELFAVIQAETGLLTHEILHVGDNAISDVIRAQTIGFQAFHYLPTKRQQIIGSPTVEKSLAHGLWRTQADHLSRSDFGKLGFLYGGPASVGFLDWISAQSRADTIQHLLFLSRDGYILERLVQTRDDFQHVNCHYFLGSRVAFTLAAMTVDNFEGFIPFLLSGGDGLAVAELLERIGVQLPAAAVLQDLGLGQDLRVAPEKYLEVATFLRAYRWEILKVATLNRRALFQYLHQLQIRPGDRVALVDVGWSGTTQEALERAIADLMEIHIQGYYFCLADTTKRQTLSQTQAMKGLLTSDSLSSEMIAALYQNRVAIEMMFSAPHHTVMGLSPTSNQVQAVFDPGRGVGIHPDDVLTVSRDINHGIAAFAHHYQALRQKLALTQPTPPLAMAQTLIDLALSADNDDINLLQSVKNFDAWGSSRHHQLDLAFYRQA